MQADCCADNTLLLARFQNVKCSDLCGLSLLLKLLELLGCDKTDRFVPCNQLRASRHGGQDDVPAQVAKTEEKKKNHSLSTNTRS